MSLLQAPTLINLSRGRRAVTFCYLFSVDIAPFKPVAIPGLGYNSNLQIYAATYDLVLSSLGVLSTFEAKTIQISAELTPYDFASAVDTAVPAGLLVYAKSSGFVMNFGYQNIPDDTLSAYRPNYFVAGTFPIVTQPGDTISFYSPQQNDAGTPGAPNVIVLNATLLDFDLPPVNYSGFAGGLG